MTDYHDTLANECVPDRRRGQPERRVRHHLHVPRRRTGGAPARPRGRQLLRVLARALLRVRSSPSRDAPTCGPSTAPQRGAARLRARSGGGRGARRRPPRRADRAGRRLLRPPRRDRHARPDPRLPPALRGVRRRPGDLLQPGGQEPPRAHHGEPRALRHRGAARVHGPRRAQQRDKATRLEPVDRRRPRPQARRRPPAAADATTTSSPPSRAGWPTAPAATPSTSGSTTSPGRPPLGGGGEFNDLIG